MKPRTADTLLMLLVLVISGNPAIYAVAGGETVVLTATAVLFAAVAFSRNVRVFDKRVAGVTAALVAIQLVQCYEFGFWPYLTIVGSLTRLFIAAALVACVKDFPRTYVRAMALLAGYCLAIWSIDQVTMALGLDFRGLFSPLEHWVGIDGEHRFCLVFTFSVLESAHRNCGVFREPGLFAGYLLLALLLALLDRDADEPAPQRRRRILLFVATLLSTLSTAAYITLPLVLAAVAFEHAGELRRAVTRKRLFVGVFVISLGTLYVVSQQTTFIEDKIERQYEELVDEAKNFEITRFGAFVLDMQAIVERPLFGWGLNEQTKYALTPELAELAPSGGVTGWMRSFGLAGLAVFLLAVYASMRTLAPAARGAAIYLTAVIVVIAQPNAFLNYPCFLTLMFIRRRAQDRDQVVPDARPIDDPSQQMIDATPVSSA